MIPSRRSTAFSIAEARDLVRDLFEHRPWIYWTDFLISVTIGYTAALLFFALPLSWQKFGFLPIAVAALYRASLFMHEVVHMSGETMRGFRIVWNLVAGVPMLTPSYFYGSHIAHHSSRHYGTPRRDERNGRPKYGCSRCAFDRLSATGITSGVSVSLPDDSD